MSKKTILLIFLVILVPIFLYFLFPSDMSRIKKLFREGAVAIEKEDIEAVMSKVSFNYRDDYGLTYLYLKESMKKVFQQLSDIKIEYENLKITVGENTASAELDVRVIATMGSDTGYILGDMPSPARLRFTLEKERTKWLITKTEGLPLDW
ncbi:MAG: hypothetical protein AB1552_03430 [Nitrospirota bacterium]